MWLPDVRWGPEATPHCPACLTNSNVGAHGFHHKHHGRRVLSLKTHYFAISRRYICHTCSAQAKAEKAAATRALEAQGVRVIGDHQTPYTFMGWDS